jgi:6-phosphogluconate dehydrogenase
MTYSSSRLTVCPAKITVTMSDCDLGLIGLAVMGQNLVLNMNDHGFKIAVFNRTAATTEKFLAGEAKGSAITPAYSIAELVGKLKRPRRVMLLVKAGQPVDDFIDQLIPLLEPGDIIIDGGNSNYTDSMRRAAYVESKGLLFVGSGVSGGEEGARRGPSLMPGGSAAAWPHIKPIFQAVAAKVADGSPCCDWVGADGSGHFVKMVHNGIEYGDMQLIAEVYHLMKHRLGMSADEMAETFSRWNKGKLDSYLIEITAEILTFKDADGSPLVDKILDAAGQKGTGRWTAEAALEKGIPLTLITEAVYARALSALKDERVTASAQLRGPAHMPPAPDKAAFLADLEQAMYAAKLMSYTQGYMLMRAASNDYTWGLNYGGVALMWRGGCIIRSAFLGKIKEAFDANPTLSNLLLDPYFNAEVAAAEGAWRRVVAEATLSGVPIPALSSALSFFDGYRSAWVPANMIQAQRDYFGAHTYERVDQPRGKFSHTDWIGSGGAVTSNAYSA